MVAVPLEVLDHLVAGGVARPVASGIGETGQRGRGLRRVQVEPVVVVPPGVPDHVGRLEDLEGSRPACLSDGRGGEAGRRGADDEGVGVVRHPRRLDEWSWPL